MSISSFWISLNGPMVVLALGLLVVGWVLLGSAGAAGWHRLMAVSLLLAGGAVLSKQALDAAMQPDRPDQSQCEALLGVEPAQVPVQADYFAPADKLGFASGPHGGPVWRMGEDLARITRQSQTRLFNLPSGGGVDNAKRLKSPANVSIGVVPSDLPLVQDSSVLGATPLGKIGAIAKLNPELVHVLTRADVLGEAAGPSLQAFKGQRVVVDVASESTLLTARYLLKWANGVGMLVESMPATTALCQVVTGQAAAMVVVAAKPTPLLARLTRLSSAWPKALQQLRFAPIPRELQTGKELDTVYEPAVIQTEDYPWLPLGSSVDTVAVRAMLVSFDFVNQTANDSKCALIRQLLCQLRRELPRLQQPPFEPAWRDVESLGSTGITGTWPVSRCVPAPTGTTNC